MITYQANATTPLRIDTGVADANGNEIPGSAVMGVNKVTLDDPTLAGVSWDNVSARSYCDITPTGKIGATTIRIERYNPSGSGPNPLVGSDTISFVGPTPHHLILKPIYPTAS